MGKVSKVQKINLAEFYKKWGVLIFLVLEIIFFIVMSSDFFTRPSRFATISNIMIVGRQVSTIGIASVGATFLMISAGIDISNGAVQAFTGVICSMMMVNYGLPIPVAILLSIIIASVFGLANGIASTVFLISPLIATLAMQTVVKGTSFLITHAAPVYGLSKTFKDIAQGYLFGIIPYPLIIMAVCFVFGWWVLNKTYLGRYFYAVGGNSEAARLSGINVKRVFNIACIASSMFAAISGVIMAGRLGSGQPNSGIDLPMDVITAVVLGGVSINGGSGKIGGVLVGVLIMGVLSNGMIILGLSDYWQWVVKGLVLLFAVGMSNIEAKRG
jgi:ribose transport system permease protein